MKGARAFCPFCHSFWDLKYSDNEFHYDENYPRERYHFESKIGDYKRASLSAWLRSLRIDLKSLTVLEVGFGSGFCLQMLNNESSCVYGVEAVAVNIEHAVGLGLPRERLFLHNELPRQLESKVDFWIFQDSFEHLVSHQDFITWVVNNSSDCAQIMLVAPDATSWSSRLIWPLWPHRVPDHQFHWSKKGVEDFFLKNGFKLQEQFYPGKYFGLRTAWSQIRRMLNWDWLRFVEQSCPNIPLKINIGEMGLIFSRVRTNISFNDRT